MDEMTEYICALRIQSASAKTLSKRGGNHMKKIIALCLAVILAASLAACGSAESSAGSAAAAFGNCQTAEDFISAAKDCLDKGDIYMANEAVRAGYVKTGDDSLRLLPLSGKPTVESTVVVHRLGMSITAVPSACCMQYFLGKELVLARASVPIFSSMLIYTFHPQTHRIQAIEVSSFLSCDKLDTDSFNIAFPAIVPIPPVFLNWEDAMEETARRETAPLNYTYRFEYTEDGTLCGVSCGETEGIVSKTATGYNVMMPMDPLQRNSPHSSELAVNLQDGKIVQITDNIQKKSEILSYQSDGSCTATGRLKDEKGNILNATVTYNKDNLADSVADSDENYTFTYNDRQMPVKITKTSKNDPNEYTYSYDSKGNLQTQTDKNNNISYLYDDAGRLVTYTKGSESHAIHYDSNNRFTGIEGDKFTNFDYQSSDGKLNSFCYPDPEHRYYIVRDADGFVLGLSRPDIKIKKLQDSPLCPDFISQINEKRIYKTSITDEELDFIVQAPTKQDYENFFTLAKADGYSEVPLEDHEDSHGEGRWLTDNLDSPTVSIRIGYPEVCSQYNIRIFKCSKDDIENGWQEYCDKIFS